MGTVQEFQQQERLIRAITRVADHLDAWERNIQASAPADPEGFPIDDPQRTSGPFALAEKITRGDKAIVIVGPDQIRLVLDRDDVPTEFIDMVAPVIINVLNEHWPHMTVKALWKLYLQRNQE